MYSQPTDKIETAFSFHALSAALRVDYPDLIFDGGEEPLDCESEGSSDETEFDEPKSVGTTATTTMTKNGKKRRDRRSIAAKQKWKKKFELEDKAARAPEQQARKASGRRKTSLKQKRRDLLFGGPIETKITRLAIEALPRELTGYCGPTSAMLADAKKDEKYPKPLKPIAIAMQPSPAPENLNRHLMVDKLIGKGWRYVPNELSTAQVFTDDAGLVFAAKPRQPSGDWLRVVDGVEKAMETLRNSIELDERHVHKIRGHFPSLTFGLTNGMGRKQPGAIRLTAEENAAIDQFEKDECVQKLIRHVKSSFKTFFPKLAAHYNLYDHILANLGVQRKVMQGSPFFATTLNDRDKCFSPAHVDSRNLVFGVCCIAVFRSFDHRLEGHNLMYPARTIFELRRGDIFFIPSGAVEHGNIPVEAEGFTRMAAVFYSAGALFRWANKKTIGDIGGPDKGKKRWQGGLSLFSKLEELRGSARKR